MQPTPVKAILCPSDSRKPKFSKDGLKRKASGDDSRRKFIKVIDESVAAAPTSAHRVDVSNVSNHDKTADPAPNGHSRTAFSRGTVKGEKIFLDLKDGHLIEDLERYIKKFGGVIEKFLSKDITCVVTSRVNIVNVRAEEHGLLNPSSLAEEKSSKKTECSLNSAAMSRGKALLLRSNSMKSSASICDPVQFAHTWNIPVVEVTVLRKLLKRENLYRKQVTSGNSKESLKKLDTPFVKVEDVMQEYSSNFKLFDAFPSGHPSFRSRAHRDPPDQAAGRRQKSRQKNPKKPGYCECCDLMFVDRDEHFQSEKHQAFIARSENFTGLDALVSELPSLEMFVQAMEMGVTGLPLAAKYGSKVDNVALCCGFLDSYVRNSMLEPPSFLRSVPLGSEYNIPGPAKVAFSNRPAVFQESKCSGVDTPSKSLSSGKKQRSGTGGSRRSSLQSYFADKNAPSSVAKSTFDDVNSFIRESPVQKFDDADNSCNNSPVDLSLAKTSTTVLAERSPLDGAGSSLPITCGLNGTDVDETLDVGDISASRVVNTGDKVSKICDLGAKNIGSTVSIETSPEIATNEMHCVKAKRNISTDDEEKDSVNVNVKCSSTLDCISKEDDLDFSSDEVSDSADDRADWRVALRSSCNKVLDILEDSVSSKGSALDVVDVKLDKTETMSTAKRLKGNLVDGVAGKLASVEMQSLNVSTQSSLNSQAVQEKIAAAGENISKETKMFLTEKSQDEKCASKTSGGFVRPWEFVPTKSNLLHQPSAQNTFDVKTRPLREPDLCFSRRSPSLTVENVCKVPTSEGLDLKLTIPCDGGSKCTASVICNSSLTTAETYCISNEGGRSADEKEKAVYDVKGEVERCASPSGSSESSVEVDVEGCDDRSVDLEDFTATSVPEHEPLALSKRDLEPSPSPNACSGRLDAGIGNEPLETGATDSEDHVPGALLDSAVSPASLQPFDEHGWKGNVRTLSSFVDTKEKKVEEGPASDSCDDNSAMLARMTTEDSERKSQNPEKDFQDAGEKFPNDSRISEIDGETVCGNSESTRDEQFMDLEKCEPAGDEQVTERHDDRVREDLQAAGYLASENTDKCLENVLNNEQSFSEPLKHSVASPVNITDEVFHSTATSDLKKDLMLLPCSIGDEEKSTSTYNKTQEENSAFDAVTVGEQSSLSSDHPNDDRDISSPHFVCNKEENETQSSCVGNISDDPPISESISTEISNGFAVVESTAETIENESHDSPLISDERSECLPALCASIQPAGEPAETSIVSDSAKGEDLVCAVQDNQNPIDKTPSHDTTRSDSPIEDLKLSVNPDTLEDNIVDINSGTSAVDVDYAERNDKEFGKSSGDLVLDETVLAEDSTVCVQSPLAICTFPPNQETLEPVAEVKAYPDLMDGIDESTNRLKVQMPDLLMPVKNAMSAVLATSHVTCGFIEIGNEPTKSGVVSDLPFEECQVDFLDQKPGLITLYGVSKDEEAPSRNISQTSLCSHDDREKEALDPWPDELVDVDRGDWSEKSCPVACAPIATPPYVFFDEEPSTQAKASLESSAASLTAPVSNLADSAVLDDDVLTTLSKILEDASKEWQAERQKAKAPSNDRGSSSALNQPLTGVVRVNAQSAGNAIMPGNELSPKSVTISNFMTNNENSGGGTFKMKTDCPVHVENTDELSCSNELTHDTGCENNVNPEAPEELGTADPTSQPSITRDQDDATEPTSAKPEEDERVDLDKLMDMLRELNGEKDCSDEFEFKPPLTSEGERRGFCETCVVHGSSKSLQDASANFCDRPEERRLFSSAKKNAQRNSDALTFQHIPTGTLRALNSLNKECDTDMACDCRTDDGLKESKKFLWRVISVSGLKIRVRRFPISLESTGPCYRTKTWSANSVGNKELTVRFARSKSNRDLAKS